MSKHRVRMVIEIEIPVEAEDAQEARMLADERTLWDIACCHWMIDKDIDTVQPQKTQEQVMCEYCGSRHWDDYLGCANCGNLNPDWMG